MDTAMLEITLENGLPALVDLNLIEAVSLTADNVTTLHLQTEEDVVIKEHPHEIFNAIHSAGLGHLWREPWWDQK